LLLLPHSKPLHHTTNNPNELADVKKTKVKYAKLTKSTPVRVPNPDRGRFKSRLNGRINGI
jgi:hypothetical protein